MAEYRAATAAGIILCCLVAGCSSGSPSAGPTVASLPTTGTTGTTAKAAAPKPTSDPNDRRPLIRFDTSLDERQRLYLAFNQCLVDHGVPKLGNATVWKPADDGTSAKYRAAGEACLTTKPEDYTEREQRRDPSTFDDDVRRQLACMKQHGLHVRPDESSNRWGWTSDQHALAEMDSSWVRTCEHQAFGQS
jgi:hypothetical protein